MKSRERFVLWDISGHAGSSCRADTPAGAAVRWSVCPEDLILTLRQSPAAISLSKRQRTNVAYLSIAFASFCGLLAGFFHPLEPGFWVPHLRADLHDKQTASRASRIFVAAVGQALTTSFVALLVTVLAFATIAFADRYTPLLGGGLVCIFAAFQFVRGKKSDPVDSGKIKELLHVVGAGSGRDPFGTYEKTGWGTVQSAVFSPGFVISPFFLAAAASGLPSVTNAFPVVITYILGNALGTFFAVRGIQAKVAGVDKRTSPPDDAPNRVAGQRKTLTAFAMFASGILAMLSG